MQEQDTKKIRDLLKTYGAKDEEIENFMQDLMDVKEAIEDAPEKVKENVADYLNPDGTLKEGKTWKEYFDKK